MDVKEIIFLLNHREGQNIYFSKGEKIKLEKNAANDLIKRGVAKEINETREKIMKLKKNDKELAWRKKQEQEEQKYIKTIQKKQQKIKKDKKNIVENIKENINKPEELLKNICFEPVLNAFTPKLLQISKKEIIPIRNQSITKTLEQPISPEIKLVFEIKNPDMWECKKCYATVQSKEKPYHCKECNRDTNFQRITSHIDPDYWKLPLWEDIPVEDLDLQNTYLDMINIIKRCLILPEEEHYQIIALWIIASWKTECWDTIGFLIFRGLIETGKTRALEIIRELGYRMMHCAGATFPAIYRSTHKWQAGLLLDEIDNKIDKRTESGRAMIDFLKQSYKRNSTYKVADLDNQDGVISYKNFGFKAFAGEKGGYDNAVFSRSIEFKMEQDYPEITELKTIEKDLNKIQTILLNYRYKTTDPPELPEEIKLKGRTREIYSSIIRTAIHIGIEYRDIINFIQQTELEKQEEIENSDEYQILKIIQDFEHQPTLDDAPETISYSDIAEQLGWESDKRQKLGYIFKKKLILKTKRRNKGSVLLLNDPKNIRKLKSLYRRFKL